VLRTGADHEAKERSKVERDEEKKEWSTYSTRPPVAACRMLPRGLKNAEDERRGGRLINERVAERAK